MKFCAKFQTGRIFNHTKKKMVDNIIIRIYPLMVKRSSSRVEYKFKVHLFKQNILINKSKIYKFCNFSYLFFINWNGFLPKFVSNIEKKKVCYTLLKENRGQIKIYNIKPIYYTKLKKQLNIIMTHSSSYMHEHINTNIVWSVY